MSFQQTLCRIELTVGELEQNVNPYLQQDYPICSGYDFRVKMLM
jgi:hypothetical protein